MPKLFKNLTRKAMTIILMGYGIVFLFLGYCFWVEPYWIEVTRFGIETKASRTIKVAFLADLHSEGLNRREKWLHETLRLEKPDAILIGGDTMAKHGNYEVVRQVLEPMEAPLGVWTVRGNWEVALPVAKHAKPLGQSTVEFYRSIGVKLLLNEASELIPGLWLVGYDDMTGTPDTIAAVAGIPTAAFRIALIHSPAYYGKIAKDADLVLAGHTHGGQVRFPGLQPFYLPKGSGPYLEGWYREQQSQLYVSRGLGNSIVEMRLGCRPELTFINLKGSD